MDYAVRDLPSFVRQTLLLSFVGWLAIQLFYQSVRQNGRLIFEGLYTFLAVFSLIAVVNYRTNGSALPVISAFTFSLLAIGVLVFLLRTVVRVFSSKGRFGKKLD